MKVKAGAQGTEFILLAALPLHEPFVMNAHAEIEQAIEDDQNNRLTV